MEDTRNIRQIVGSGVEGGVVGAVDVQAWVLLLPLGAPVLEPDLHLRLGEVEAQGEVESLAHRQVPRLSELVLQ